MEPPTFMPPRFDAEGIRSSKGLRLSLPRECSRDRVAAPREPDLESLRGYPSFDELVRPKG